MKCVFSLLLIEKPSCNLKISLDVMDSPSRVKLAFEYLVK